MKPIVIGLCLVMTGWMTFGTGSSVAVAAGSGYHLWAETYGPDHDACGYGNAADCYLGNDFYAEVKGTGAPGGPPTFVDLQCETFTRSSTTLYEQLAEITGPGSGSTVVPHGVGVVLKNGPTASAGGSGLMAVTAQGSWSDSGMPFTGHGSAAGAFTTGPFFPQDTQYGPITAGRISISITGTIFHKHRPLTSTSGADWVADPPTTGTKTCAVVPGPDTSDAYAHNS